jgi:hypothetical protein
MAIELAIEVLTDPDFLSAFTIQRRQEVIGDNGRTSIIPVVIPALGIVAPEGENSLKRTEDYGLTVKTLVIITLTFLTDSKSGYLPDFIDWAGNRYVVKEVSPYANYGSGFYQAHCESTEQLDS